LGQIRQAITDAMLGAARLHQERNTHQTLTLRVFMPRLVTAAASGWGFFVIQRPARTEHEAQHDHGHMLELYDYSENPTSKLNT